MFLCASSSQGGVCSEAAKAQPQAPRKVRYCDWLLLASEQTPTFSSAHPTVAKAGPPRALPLAVLAEFAPGLLLSGIAALLVAALGLLLSSGEPPGGRGGAFCLGYFLPVVAGKTCNTATCPCSGGGPHKGGPTLS